MKALLILCCFLTACAARTVITPSAIPGGAPKIAVEGGFWHKANGTVQVASVKGNGWDITVQTVQDQPDGVAGPKALGDQAVTLGGVVAFAKSEAKRSDNEAATAQHARTQESADLSRTLDSKDLETTTNAGVEITKSTVKNPNSP